MNNRDEFPQKIKDVLCERVGGKCSNPNCRCETKGPHSVANKRVSVGQAAHITAASEGGPRYDASLTSVQRRSAENGIWLCEICAKMIDSDPALYSVTLLRSWKYQAEAEQENKLTNRYTSSIQGVDEKRSRVACREIKGSLDDLHGIICYAYEYWTANFARFDEFELEKEISQHYNLYENELKEIYTYNEKQLNLHEKLKEYGLDLGKQLHDELVHYLNFIWLQYSGDSCGFYNDYWKCFFINLSINYEKLTKCKKRIDNMLQQRYEL